ncbi:hypothetical protein EDD17DRAFT_1751214 [Pisolithus thermaeus]|nr:hypothetical protein EDD17DRAFT_1751214 [Pisolithus thermaeus]
MKLLNVEAVLDRDKGIQRAGHETEVMKELHDKTNSYAILSHRWGSDSEVSYEEMTGLMKMRKEDREEVTQRCGYQKIIKSCEQAKKDGYDWLWIDTCCIDKRSSAELTEAINSMYRWYRNSQVCYVYLNDIDKSEFPTERDFSLFGKSNGWPEWFSRGWTLQELIAPRNAEFFNKDWESIGSKESLMSTLTAITRIPEVVLRDEGILRVRVDISRRLRVAQIMSWAAERETTRVEDRAYSLLGLFGVNMPMLYGEGSKAFQRLQLEIIRVSSDHSIFAWNPKGRFGLHPSVLADHPGCFRGCHDIQEVHPDRFVKELQRYTQWKGLQVATNWNKLTGLQRGAESTQFFRFDVANLGIQVLLPVIRVIPLPPRDDTNKPECYMALLPCYDRYGKLFTINLQSIEHSFHKYFRTVHVPEECPVFRSLYLEFSQYAEESYRELRFHDKRTSYYGFTRRGAFPHEIADDTVTLSSQGNNLTVLVYANDKDRSRFAVGFGHYCNEIWAHIFCDIYPADRVAWSSWGDFAEQVYNTMWNTPLGEGHPPQYSTHKILSRGHLPRSAWDAMIIHFGGDRNMDITDIMIDIKPCPGCCAGPRECTYDLFPDELWFLSTRNRSFVREVHELELDGQSVCFEEYFGRIALGDYGRFNKNNFQVVGNIFQDMQELDIDSMDPVYQPIVSPVSGSQRVPHRMQTQQDIVTCGINYDSLVLRQPKGHLLPNNAEFNLLLRALSSRTARRHLVTAVIQCSAFYRVNDKPTQKDASASVQKGGEQSMGPGVFTPLCIFHPSAPHGSPACVQRREKLKNIREHFYALANLHLSETEPCHGSLRDKRALNGLVDCSDMFGLESLKCYVGEIAFFKRLPSMMETRLRNEDSVGRAGGNGLSTRPPSLLSFSSAGLRLFGDRLQPDTKQNQHCEAVASLLVNKFERLHEHSYSEKSKTQIEVESIARTLSVGLLEHIFSALLDASEGKPQRDSVGHADCDTVNIHSTIREIEALRVRFQATEDDDEHRALEEDITGKILWFYRCGIRSEVDQVLSGVINYISAEPNSKTVLGGAAVRGFLEMAEIVKSSPRISDLDGDQAHLQRIMLDGGAGISRHELWLTAQAAERAKWSGVAGRKLNTSGTQRTTLSTRHKNAPSTSNTLRTSVTGKERL